MMYDVSHFLYWTKHTIIWMGDFPVGTMENFWTLLKARFLGRISKFKSIIERSDFAVETAPWDWITDMSLSCIRQNYSHSFMWDQILEYFTDSISDICDFWFIIMNTIFDSGALRHCVAQY